MAEPLNKSDLGNLANLVARATFNGVQEASAGVVLFSKLQALLNEQPEAPKPVEEKTADGNDSKGSA